MGHVFKLGTFLSEKLGAIYIDDKGVPHPIVMGCYGIGLGRLLAAAIEQSHDVKGIIWPLSIAPYQIYLCPLYQEDSKIDEAAENLYAELEAGGEALSGLRDEVYSKLQEYDNYLHDNYTVVAHPIRNLVGMSLGALLHSTVHAKVRQP